MGAAVVGSPNGDRHWRLRARQDSWLGRISSPGGGLVCLEFGLQGSGLLETTGARRMGKFPWNVATRCLCMCRADETCPLTKTWAAFCMCWSPTGRKRSVNNTQITGIANRYNAAPVVRPPATTTTDYPLPTQSPAKRTKKNPKPQTHPPPHIIITSPSAPRPSPLCLSLFFWGKKEIRLRRNDARVVSAFFWGGRGQRLLFCSVAEARKGYRRLRNCGKTVASTGVLRVNYKRATA